MFDPMSKGVLECCSYYFSSISCSILVVSPVHRDRSESKILTLRSLLENLLN